MRSKGIIISGVIITVLCLIVVQSYVKRGMQASVKDARDAIGSQWSSRNSGPLKMNQQMFYEPYYQNSGYVAEGKAQDGNQITVRKLIHTAEICLEINDTAEALKTIGEIAKRFSGFIQQSQTFNYNAQPESGRIIFKVDPKEFENALNQLRAMGRVETENVSGSDVTDQHIDLTARLKNAQRVQERLLSILEKDAKQVKDILEVERELSRTGEQIERLEGQLKLLNHQVDLATITITYHEKQAVVPSSWNVVKEFKQTLHVAFERMIDVFNGILIALAMFIPVAFWLTVGGGIFLGIRKIRASKKVRDRGN